MANSRKIIYSIFERSWGEVDWILPVLYELKRQRPDWKLICAFSPQWKGYNSYDVNRTVRHELEQVSDDIIKVDDLSDPMPGIDPKDVALITSDDTVEDFTKAVQAHAPDATFALHLHGTLVQIGQRFNHPRRFNQWEKFHWDHDIYLHEFEEEATWINARVSDAKISYVGFPPHDKWWLDHLLNSEVLTESEEKKIVADKKRVFCFFARGIDRCFVDDAYFYVMDAIGELILSDPDNYLLMRAHPRQDKDLLIKSFEKFGYDNWKFTSLHAMQVASLSDFAISVASSLSLDPVCLGKPTVEFQQYLEPTELLLLDENGRYENTHPMMGLAVPARTKERLAELIDNYFDPNADHTIWENQKRRLEEISPRERNDSERVAKHILSVVEPEQAAEGDRLPIYIPSDQLGIDTPVFLKPKEDGSGEKFEVSLQKIHAHMLPINKRLFGELVKFYDLETMIATGTFSEQLAEVAGEFLKDVHMIESASDLYQADHLYELKSNPNVKVYNSKSILEHALASTSGNTFFWLSTHESAGNTDVSPTNTPVIEELKTIAAAGKKDCIILIDKVRYFQPHVLRPFNAKKTRQYPTIQEAADIIGQIGGQHQIFLVGDVLLALPLHADLSMTAGVQACMLSRFYNEEEISDDILKAEAFISGHLQPEEKAAIASWCHDFDFVEESGVASHYFYWHGLVLIGEGRFQEAMHYLQKAHDAGLQHKRVLVFYNSCIQQLTGQVAAPQSE